MEGPEAGIESDGKNGRRPFMGGGATRLVPSVLILLSCILSALVHFSSKMANLAYVSTKALKALVAAYSVFDV